MSIIISSLLIFFLCFSVHTCNARHPAGVMDDDNASHKKLLSSIKVLGSSVELNRDNPIWVEEGTSGDDIVFHQSHATATVDVKPKDSDNFVEEMEQKREMSSVNPVPTEPLVSVSGRVARKIYDERSANFKPSSHMGLLRATSIEGSSRRGLSVVEHKHGFNYAEEGRDNKAQEDESEPDYDPPHTVPPIHNS